MRCAQKFETHLVPHTSVNWRIVVSLYSRGLRCRDRLLSQKFVQEHSGFPLTGGSGLLGEGVKGLSLGSGAVEKLDTLGQRYYSPSALVREQGTLNSVVHGCTGMLRLDVYLKYVLEYSCTGRMLVRCACTCTIWD